MLCRIYCVIQIGVVEADIIEAYKSSESVVLMELIGMFALL